MEQSWQDWVVEFRKVPEGQTQFVVDITKVAVQFTQAVYVQLIHLKEHNEQRLEELTK